MIVSFSSSRQVLQTCIGTHGRLTEISRRTEFKASSALTVALVQFVRADLLHNFFQTPLHLWQMFHLRCSSSHQRRRHPGRGGYGPGAVPSLASLSQKEDVECMHDDVRSMYNTSTLPS